MLKQYIPAIKVSAFFLLFSLLWIFTSDNIAASIAPDKESLMFIQTIKGWFYVTVTAILVFLFTHKYIKAEQQLNNKLQSKTHELSTIIDNAPIPTIVFNEEGELLMMNKVWLELTGYDFEEINTLEKWTQRAYRGNDALVKEAIKEIFNITQREDNGEYTIWTKDNRQIVWHFYSTPFGMQNGKRTIISSAIDVTQVKQQNDMIIQQSKMAALGEMIENIAHQWRQPLSSISALSSGIQLKNEVNDLDSNYINESMKTIGDNAQYLSNTIDDFRNFFDKEKIKRFIKIDDAVQKAIDLVKPRVISHNIEIVTYTKKIEIETFENELIQVIINLLNNSIDELKKTTKERLIIIKTETIQKQLVITIQDSAGGIPKEILPKIFEPYFTTKAKNHGTGIGLFMSDEIITKHCAGSIEASNTSFIYGTKEFHGANFTICLPLH